MPIGCDGLNNTINVDVFEVFFLSHECIAYYSCADQFENLHSLMSAFIMYYRIVADPVGVII